MTTEKQGKDPLGDPFLSRREFLLAGAVASLGMLTDPLAVIQAQEIPNEPDSLDPRFHALLKLQDRRGSVTSRVVF